VRPSPPFRERSNVFLPVGRTTPCDGARPATYLRAWPVRRRHPAALVVLGVLAIGCADATSDVPRRPADAAAHDIDASRPLRDAGARADASSGRVLDAQVATPVLLRARAELVQIRPRPLVDVHTAEPNDLDASTAAWPIEGSAVLYSTSEGVDLVLKLQQCRTGYAYPVFVYEGSDCAAVTRDAAVWDGTRGAGISSASCLGAPGARVDYARPSSAAKPWALSGPAAQSLLGRLLAVLDPDTREPLICGQIVPADAGPAVGGAPLSPAIAGQLGGLCLLSSIAIGQTQSDGKTCPDAEAFGKCAATHCDLSRCATECAEHQGCLERASEPCSGECVASEPCSTCLDGFRCALGFCAEHIACAAPRIPNGHCEQLEACCRRQGPLVEGCLQQAHQLELLGGDPTCLGILYDWDFNTNVTYRSPCYPDGGAAIE